MRRPPDDLTDDLTDEDRRMLKALCHERFKHLMGIAQDDGPNVSGQSRAQLRQKAEAYAELASKFGRGSGITGYRSER